MLLLAQEDLQLPTAQAGWCCTFPKVVSADQGQDSSISEVMA